MRYHHNNQSIPVETTLTTTPTQLFIVHVRPNYQPEAKSFICHSFILMAANEEDACNRLRNNAEQLIGSLLSVTAEKDLEKVTFTSTEQKLTNRQIEDLDIEFEYLSNKYEDETDRNSETELSKVHQETLVELLKANREKRKNAYVIVEHQGDSAFSERIKLLTEILAPTTKLIAEPLNHNRVYSVSYFDDTRSYLTYFP